MTRTLSDAHPATGAALEINIVPFVRAQLDDRIFRTCRQAVVAFVTVAAREAALRFPDCRRLVQTGNDFLERRRSRCRCTSTSLKIGKLSMPKVTIVCLGGGAYAVERSHASM